MRGILRFFTTIAAISVFFYGLVVLIDAAYEKYGRNYVE